MFATYRATVVLLFVISSHIGECMTNNDGVTAKEVDIALTAYYPDSFPEGEEGLMDTKGNRLRTLQDFLDGRASYVTVSTDPKLRIPYGTKVIIPSLNDHFGVKGGIKFEARDFGGNMDGEGFSRLDICVRSEQDSYDIAVNRAAKAIFLLPTTNADNNDQNGKT